MSANTESLEQILGKLRHGGYYLQARMNLPFETRLHIETTSWAGEQHQQEMHKLAIAEIQALIEAEANRRELELVKRVEERFRVLPRHRPTNTSLWDGVQMNRAIEVLHAELAQLQQPNNQEQDK